MVWSIVLPAVSAALTFSVSGPPCRGFTHITWNRPRPSGTTTAGTNRRPPSKDSDTAARTTGNSATYGACRTASSIEAAVLAADVCDRKVHHEHFVLQIRSRRHVRRVSAGNGVAARMTKPFGHEVLCPDSGHRRRRDEYPAVPLAPSV
jgi:hypothetical protein